MVEDPKVQHLIRWNGDSFVVNNQEEFSRELLPSVFKHNNFASFVRQLNMYGFHKVNTDSIPSAETHGWEFSHPNFQKGKPAQLFEIKRRVPAKGGGRGKGESNQVEAQVNEEVLERIEKLESDVVKLQETNLTLTTELVACKQFIKEQRYAINQIIQYLGSTSSTSEATAGEGKVCFLLPRSFFTVFPLFFLTRSRFVS